ncbi:MAG: AMP-dependent synthetase and ligase, partial [Gammaproteobacteria bacterium]|nr:AMP-dependent synthetase and ligase [Gammaproteobacteria bacterium]
MFGGRSRSFPSRDGNELDGPSAVSSISIVPGTADAELLSRPLRTLADIERIERMPLDERLSIADFYQRIALALAARNRDETAIHFLPDGDIEGIVHETSFATLRGNIERHASVLRSRHIGRLDVVAIVLPTMPAAYWTIIGTMAQAVPFPVNWMLEPEYLLRLLAEADVKAIVALGPTPGFHIWESIMSIKDRLPAGLPIWSVAAPGSTILPESDLDLQLGARGHVAPDPAGTAGTHQGSDLAAYVHSGGTTGLPKIVRLSHRNMSYRHWTLQLAMQITLGEIVLQD